MPSSKTTRNTRQKQETVPAAESAQQLESASPARKTRSLKAKPEVAETTRATTHRNVVTGSSEKPVPTAAVAAPKAKAAAAAAVSSAAHVSPVAESITVTTMAEPIGDVLMQDVTSAQIADLAHSYFVARGHQHGSAEEDWLRAERELQNRS
jgi:hypothetical protein